MKQPQTPTEWQEAVDLAHGALVLDSARQYGLVTGGPTVDVSRCEQFLRDGRRLGITPGRDALDRFLCSLDTPHLKGPPS